MIKKYDIVQRRPYPDDQGVVEDVPIESDSGRWVPAEVAEELYIRLHEFDRFCSADQDYIGSPFKESVRLALAKARGEQQ